MEVILQLKIAKLLQRQRELQIQELNGGFYKLMVRQYRSAPEERLAV